MSLNWEMPEEFYNNHKNLMYTEEDKNGNCKVQVELECLIFSTMMIQHDMDGEMTDEKLKEIQRRITLLDGIGSLMSWTVWDGNAKRQQSVNLESVIRYWGLQTNVSHLSEKKWNAFFHRISVPRYSEWEYVLNEAKKNAQDKTQTQPDRVLKLLKEQNAKLDNPPPVEV